MLFCRKKFPVHVVISILRHSTVLRFLYMTYIFFSLFQSQDPMDKGMSDFDSGNSVLLDVNLYETKREK